MLKEHYQEDLIRPDSNLEKELAFSSLEMIWMTVAIDQEFGIRLSGSDYAKIDTVQDLCDFIDENKKS